MRRLRGLHRGLRMKKELKCLRCGTVMRSMGMESIQLGHVGLFLGQLDNKLTGTLDVEIMVCPACHKLELYECGGGEIEPPVNPARLNPVEPEGGGAEGGRPPFGGYRTRGHARRRKGKRQDG